MSLELLIIPLSGVALGGIALLFNKVANKPGKIADEARAAKIEEILTELRSEIDAIKGAEILNSIEHGANYNLLRRFVVTRMSDAPPPSLTISPYLLSLLNLGHPKPADTPSSSASIRVSGGSAP